MSNIVSFSYLLNKKRMPENKTDKVDNESKSIDKLARSLDQVSNVPGDIKCVQYCPCLISDLIMTSFYHFL